MAASESAMTSPSWTVQWTSPPRTVRGQDILEAGGRLGIQGDGQNVDGQHARHVRMDYTTVQAQVCRENSQNKLLRYTGNVSARQQRNSQRMFQSQL